MIKETKAQKLYSLPNIQSEVPGTRTCSINATYLYLFLSDKWKLMVNCGPHHLKLKCPVKTSDPFPNDPILFRNKSFQPYLPICLYMCRKIQEHTFVPFYGLCLTTTQRLGTRYTHYAASSLWITESPIKGLLFATNTEIIQWLHYNSISQTANTTHTDLWVYL